jgi:hypothetical protein
MNGDASAAPAELIAGYKQQLETFHKSDQDRDDMFNHLMQEYEKLSERYEGVLEEYENEKAGRQMWHKRAKHFELEHTILKRSTVGNFHFIAFLRSMVLILQASFKRVKASQYTH